MKRIPFLLILRALDHSGLGRAIVRPIADPIYKSILEGDPNIDLHSSEFGEFYGYFMEGNPNVPNAVIKTLEEAYLKCHSCGEWIFEEYGGASGEVYCSWDCAREQDDEDIYDQDWDEDR